MMGQQRKSVDKRQVTECIATPLLEGPSRPMSTSLGHPPPPTSLPQLMTLGLQDRA